MTDHVVRLYALALAANLVNAAPAAPSVQVTSLAPVTETYLDEADRPFAALVPNRPREVVALRAELGSAWLEAA